MGHKLWFLFYDAVFIKHPLNSHNSIQLGFQADSPYFLCLVSKYQNGEFRPFLCWQPHISVKEIQKVCGRGKSGLFCLKVKLDFGFVIFVNICECCLN